MARHGLLMLLEVLLLGLVLFWCAPAQQKAAGHKQRVPEGLSLSSSFILTFHRICLLFALLLVRARPTQGGRPQAASPSRFVSFLHLYSFFSQCCGSGFVSFWPSQIPTCHYLYGSGLFHYQAKKNKENLDFYCFVSSLSKKTYHRFFLLFASLSVSVFSVYKFLFLSVSKQKNF